MDRLAENDFSARVDVLRKEVIANVSPELRSPLSVISGYAELVRDIHWKDEAARNEDAAATYGIRVRFDVPKESVFIYADPLKLSQVLRNLLYNAINHTPEGDTITISLETKADHTLRLSVTNPVSTILNAHGMKYGVDSDEKETVFWFEVTKADVPQES